MANQPWKRNPGEGKFAYEGLNVHMPPDLQPKGRMPYGLNVAADLIQGTIQARPGTSLVASTGVNPNPPAPPPPSHGPIVAGTLSIWFASGPTSAYNPFIGYDVWIGQSPVIGVIPGGYNSTSGGALYSAASGYPALTHITYVLSAPQIAALGSGVSGNLIVTGELLGSTLNGNVSPANTLLTYDCYLDATYADTTTARVRPVAALNVVQNVGNGTKAGVTTNTNLAIDVDSTPPTTFATYTRTLYSGVDIANYLQMNF